MHLRLLLCAGIVAISALPVKRQLLADVDVATDDVTVAVEGDPQSAPIGDATVVTGAALDYALSSDAYIAALHSAESAFIPLAPVTGIDANSDTAIQSSDDGSIAITAINTAPSTSTVIPTSEPAVGPVVPDPNSDATRTNEAQMTAMSSDDESKRVSGNQGQTAITAASTPNAVDPRNAGASGYAAVPLFSSTHEASETAAAIDGEAFVQLAKRGDESEEEEEEEEEEESDDDEESREAEEAVNAALKSLNSMRNSLQSLQTNIDSIFNAESRNEGRSEIKSAREKLTNLRAARSKTREKIEYALEFDLEDEYHENLEAARKYFIGNLKTLLSDAASNYPIFERSWALDDPDPEDHLKTIQRNVNKAIKVIDKLQNLF